MLAHSLDKILLNFNIVCEEISVNDLHLDSRNVGKGDVFVAVTGMQVDGRKFIESAVNAGAVAVIQQCQHEQQHGEIEYQLGVPIVSFWRLDQLLSQLGHAAYFSQGNPLHIVGVTGTNGKSTITHLIAALAQDCGVPAAVMGTLGNGVPGQLQPSINTTADPITIQRQLADYAKQGIKLVAMEVSSHGLQQGRVAAVPFNGAVFSNLSRDHLDYHGTMAEYGRAKQALFDWPTLSYRLINSDDAFGLQMLETYPSAQSLSTLNSNTSWYLSEIMLSEKGLSTQWCSEKLGAKSLMINAALLGRFNADNLLAALVCLFNYGLGPIALQQACAKIQSVPGRMELFHANRKAAVVVDYAHTPDALEKALLGAKAHCIGQLWCIFGCGGDRDQGKRPMMAKVAELGADKVIVTDDNPRFENPAQIIKDIVSGFTQADTVLVCHDRREALRLALSQTASEDVILIAGKGHENYQIVGASSIDYDERAVVAQLLAEVSQ
ncbi:UDP-N-acetylmuramoyl-L-alanyl-D-glutamate--2,6-diaminopimelate ligase [Alginatibacterium sediminis]|uniref:UDP-N-acetylmuramoyl-L-alanyl-D-glutamate--2,6-diaminopimelate ligase n=1 Tax=Alginatibacterium sediminis TaxID=2164068 RepID=A0A420E8T3_9ALTE|nr:UDP-N-acetylmuramoyl-L-alanyl-D-glutamate--2,6-diaminopimelate ligase [Alginatibacterium sediminis]RKF15889.1 UDP-N-acetylmuramoyl-L-alanyl-D-glutamate--2,6-diaminopimelate ligase [Alginatibacterium sediminis]